jgi:hypothetical protein
MMILRTPEKAWDSFNPATVTVDGKKASSA